MSEKQERRLRENGLAFFGTIAASVSHEINNVLAILNEYSGLLEDLLQGAEQGRALKLEKLTTLSQNIGKQVKRGEQIIKRLNRFAHLVDEPFATCHLNALLEDIVELSRRFASLKKVRLESRIPQDPCSVTTDPFGLHQAVFACIRRIMDGVPPGEYIEITLEPAQAGAVVRISGPSRDPGENVAEQSAFFSHLLENFGGTAEVRPELESRRCLVLFIPRNMPRRAEGNKETARNG